MIYWLLVEIPANATVGLWEEIINDLAPDDSAVGITTNRL